MVKTILSNNLPPPGSAIEAILETQRVKWQRRGYSKAVSGIVYSLEKDGGACKMVVRRDSGVWEDVSNGYEEYRRQDDGWFIVETKEGSLRQGGWFKLRDGFINEALDAMELDMDKHLSELIVVYE